MATVAETLEMAASLIEPEGAWTTGAFARDARHHPVPEHEDDAKCFCVAGAIYRVTISAFGASRALTFFSDALALDGQVATWNDAPERTQAEVVAALRAAAAKAREVRS
jgi:hypothetical protein